MITCKVLRTIMLAVIITFSCVSFAEIVVVDLDVVDTNGMTGIDFSDYEQNTAHWDSNVPYNKMIPDHGMRLDCNYLDGAKLLMWNARNVGDPCYAGPALVLMRTDTGVPPTYLPRLPNPFTISFWAKDGSGEPATVSSIFIWFLASPNYMVSLFDVQGNLIKTTEINPDWYGGLGWRIIEDGHNVSLIHKLTIQTMIEDEQFGNWSSISGDLLSPYDIYYDGYATNFATCSDVWLKGYGMAGDTDKNCIVDWKDMDSMVENWLVSNDPK